MRGPRRTLQERAGFAVLLRAGGVAEAPVEEAVGIVPDAVAGVAEDDGDDFVAVAGRARDEAMAGGFGIAGFHAVAEGVAFQDAVRVLEDGGVAIGVLPRRLLDGD